jgi:toxin ParE1/3/4
MKAYEVRLTQDAQADLSELYEYVAGNDSPLKAQQLLDKIETVIEKLSHFPQRGTITKELSKLGIREYREVYFKPYRIIYRVIGEQVFVYLIVDGRCDMATVLLRRLARV